MSISYYITAQNAGVGFNILDQKQWIWFRKTDANSGKVQISRS